MSLEPAPKLSEIPSNSTQSIHKTCMFWNSRTNNKKSSTAQRYGRHILKISSGLCLRENWIVNKRDDLRWPASGGAGFRRGGGGGFQWAVAASKNSGAGEIQLIRTTFAPFLVSLFQSEPFLPSLLCFLAANIFPCCSVSSKTLDFSLALSFFSFPFHNLSVCRPLSFLFRCFSHATPGFFLSGCPSIFWVFPPLGSQLSRSFLFFLC